MVTLELDVWLARRINCWLCLNEQWTSYKWLNIFTAMAPYPIQSISQDVRLSPTGNPASWWTGDFCLKSLLVIWATLLPYFLVINHSDDFLCFEIFRVFGSLQTSLLGIVGELAGGGCVALTVGDSDTWPVTGGRWHRTHVAWHMLLLFLTKKIVCFC